MIGSRDWFYGITMPTASMALDMASKDERLDADTKGYGCRHEGIQGFLFGINKQKAKRK